MGADLNAVVDPRDEAAGDYPKNTQIACMAQPSPGSMWSCILPVFHAGEHCAGPYRWASA